MADENTITATGERGVDQLKAMLSAVDESEVERIEVTLTYADDDPEPTEEETESDPDPEPSTSHLPADAWKVDNEQVADSVANVPADSDRLANTLKWVAAQDDPVIFSDVLEAVDRFDKSNASTVLGDLFRRGALARRGSPPYEYRVSTAGENVLRQWQANS